MQANHWRIQEGGRRRRSPPEERNGKKKENKEERNGKKKEKKEERKEKRKKLKIDPRALQFSKFSGGILESFFPRFTCQDNIKLLPEEFKFGNLPGGTTPGPL